MKKATVTNNKLLKKTLNIPRSSHQYFFEYQKKKKKLTHNFKENKQQKSKYQTVEMQEKRAKKVVQNVQRF